MSRETLSIETLPAWSLLNDITFVDVKVADTYEKGYGLVSQRHLSTKDDTYDIPTLLTVPHALVLNAEAVEQYAKEDKNFRLLLEAAGHKVLYSRASCFSLSLSLFKFYREHG